MSSPDHSDGGWIMRHIDPRVKTLVWFSGAVLVLGTSAAKVYLTIRRMHRRALFEKALAW